MDKVTGTIDKNAKMTADAINNTKERAKQGFNNSKEGAKQGLASTKNFFKSGSVLSQIVIVILIFILIIIIIEIIKAVYLRIKNGHEGKPWLVKGIKSAKTMKVIPQDPSHDDSVLIKRSSNESKGIEFTYVLWIYVNDWDYKYGDWKHVFHKGNQDSWPNRAPGVWLAPKTNAMRIYMNTYSEIAQYIDIDNIPLHKWMHLTIMAYSNKIDIFINGFLKKQLILNGIIRQNYGDLYVNSFGGYDGFLSNMRYYDYAISLNTIENIIRQGPSSKSSTCTSLQKDGSTPPYLSSNWWLTYKY
jgi:hypothetical protein